MNLSCISVISQALKSLPYAVLVQLAIAVLEVCLEAMDASDLWVFLPDFYKYQVFSRKCNDHCNISCEIRNYSS